jgi:hypothetical protein
MGCCEVKKEINEVLEVDLQTKHEDSFNDLSISSHHCHTSNVFPDKIINLPVRDRSISNTYPNTLEQAFIASSPMLRASEVTKTAVFFTSEDTELSVIKEENRESGTRRN